MLLLRRALLLLIALPLSYAAEAPTLNITSNNTKPSVSPFVAHRFYSANNITILHEVHENVDEGDDDDDDYNDGRPPIVLNTHEVLPAKPHKKKPYALYEKTLLTEYEKPRPLKEYELHPVIFDYNLGDLEDLEHEARDLDAGAQPNVLGSYEGISYTEPSPDQIADAVVGDELQANNHTIVGVAVETTTQATTTTSSIVTSTTTTSTSTTTTATATADFPPLPVDLPISVTVSPNIFKVLKTKTKIKGRELQKKDSAALGVNSISRYFGLDEESVAAASTNDTAESANLFQLLINLYDHFYWQPSRIRSKVTTTCAIELQAYLTALNANYEWAQRAYDASGRYRGQAFYGNDKWLGEKAFCYELNRQLQPEERKHFEFEFYVAVVAIEIWLPAKVDLLLQLGECLPKSCTPQDIQTILTLDPHAQMLTALSANGNASPTAQFNIQRVRTVPGSYNYWLELKFQIFVSFMLTLILVVIMATWYQSKLSRHNCTINTTAFRAISAKMNHAQQSAACVGERYTGKAFELYQMSNLNGVDNNNVDVEADLNGTSQYNNNNNNNNNNSGCSSNGGKTADTNGNASSCSSGAAKKSGLETELKAQLCDYKAETCSSAGATATYEAKKQLALHQKILLCFAFQTNAGVILNIEDNKESQTSCVHGLRVFSVLWTILVHTYLQMFTIGENRFTRIIVERSIWYQFVGNATFSVDTFFFISGFLVTLLYLKQEKKYPEEGGQFLRRSLLDTSVILIYRYIRLTPAYLFVIFFNDFMLRQTFDASVFQPSVVSNTCSLYWWRNIFYINNFYPLSEICMIWSWYMANDMQFYIMASLLLIVSTRYFKTTVVIIGSFLLSSWAVSGIISLHYNYTHKVAHPFESFDFLYDKPWQRVGTYIVGMLAGYIMYKVKNPPKVRQRTNLLLWAGSLGLLFIIIFGVWEGQLSLINTAFYVSIGHTAFGLALTWIVLSCCWGLSNPVNRVLAYRGLWPLSRLTYCTYLIHPVIMLLISFRMEGTVHLNNLFVMSIFLGNAVLSFVVAFFISVLFEAPVIRLLKICFKK